MVRYSSWQWISLFFNNYVTLTNTDKLRTIRRGEGGWESPAADGFFFLCRFHSIARLQTYCQQDDAYSKYLPTFIYNDPLVSKYKIHSTQTVRYTYARVTIDEFSSLLNLAHRSTRLKLANKTMERLKGSETEWNVYCWTSGPFLFLWDWQCSAPVQRLVSSSGLLFFFSSKNNVLK